MLTEMWRKMLYKYCWILETLSGGEVIICHCVFPLFVITHSFTAFYSFVNSSFQLTVYLLRLWYNLRCTCRPRALSPQSPAKAGK